MKRDPLTGETVHDALDRVTTDLLNLRDAVELMDTKITSYGEREDGTVRAYIVGDSTWHRVLAIARGSLSEKAEKALREFRLRRFFGDADYEAHLAPAQAREEGPG